MIKICVGRVPKCLISREMTQLQNTHRTEHAHTQTHTHSQKYSSVESEIELSIGHFVTNAWILSAQCGFGDARQTSLNT